jgi:gliding motility-associated-like protein
MKLRLLLSAFAAFFVVNSYSQTVIYSEDFTTGATWTINTITGAEGATPNPWFISCQEDGEDPGNCGTGCIINDNSLHVGSALGDLGAAYFETGVGATNTNRRAESGDINTVGQTNLTLNFDMIGWGGNADDFCDLVYSTDGGGTWTSLATPLTSQCCGGVACTGPEQGLWQNNTYALPAACENIPNLRIGFVWINLDDGIATDPSFAVDDIEITTPSVAGPTADFTASNTTICEGDCIDFTDASTLGTNPTWNWTFTGAATANSTNQNPTNICYPTAGTYTVELTVTDDNGNDTETKVNYITVNTCTGVTAAFTPSQTTICAGDCITFADNSTGGVTGWTWTLNGGTPPSANTQDPGSVCFNTPGVHDITLEVTDGTNTDQTTVQITVNDLPNVTASVAPSDSICAGDQVTLTGAGAATYTWDNGVTDGVAFAPTTTTTYNVIGTDANGCERGSSVTVVVSSCDTIDADFTFNGSGTVCLGDCIDFTSTSTGTIASYNWDFGGGGTPATSTSPDPTVCFDQVGTFDIKLVITDASGGMDSLIQQVSVITAPSVTAVLDTVITLGGSANLIALASGPGSYLWTPDERIDCDTCSTTFASPWEDTDYVVTITDINGCAGTDTVHVYVNFVEAIGVPSAFSPNGDGENDVLYVKGIGITRLQFSVYNRYGEKVFETDNQNIGWDGTFLGRDENSGVFAWQLEYTLVNGRAGILKGNTTLVR